MAKYESFQELQENETEDEDYFIKVEDRSSPIVVMAPHGGKIEFVTCELAEQIAADDYSLYCFKGIKEEDNWDLRITSHKFDEPQAIKLVKSSNTALTIHGQRNREEEFVVVGGRDEVLRKKLKERLSRYYTLKRIEGIMGTSPQNICNRTKRNRGAQLEISQKLRSTLKRNEDERERFVSLVRKALAEVNEQ